jgi:uncharacterized membrane protein HdeD (DUF308 family)
VNSALARFLSILFHPLLMPTFLFYLVLYWLPESVLTFPMEKRWIILGFIFFCTFLIPGLGAYAMVRYGVVNSIELGDREQRRYPLLFTTLCYATLTYLFQRNIEFGELFYYLMLLITLSVCVTYLVSLFWKISAHSVGLGGFLGLLVLLNELLPESSLLYLIAFFIVVSGAVISARLALNEHTPAQVYAGFLAGLAISSSFLFFI